jgi:hypothetical protein
VVTCSSSECTTGENISIGEVRDGQSHGEWYICGTAGHFNFGDQSDAQWGNSSSKIQTQQLSELR